MNPVIYAFASILLIAGSQLFFKYGSDKVESKLSNNSGVLLRMSRSIREESILIGLVLNGFAALCWLLALSSLDLSFIFPFLGLNYILVPLLASFYFQEKLSRQRILGMVTICLGILLIANS